MNTLGRRSLCGAAAICLFAVTFRLSSQAPQPSTPPLPDPASLLQAASKKEDEYAIERQRYLCVFKNTKFITHTARLYESFYVHGHEVQRLLAVNDVPLSPEQKRAEEARVLAEIAADQKKPVVAFVGLAGGMWISADEHRWSETVEGSIVRATIFKNERHVIYQDRPAIQIDFEGNSRFKPHTPEESIARAMSSIKIGPPSRSTLKVTPGSSRIRPRRA